MASHLFTLSEDLSVYVGGPEGNLSTESEAQFIHKEIFQDHCYDVPTLSNDKDLFIVDVGANIGMFSLYMKKKYPSAKILAFEPAPQTYDILKQNLAHHSIADVETFPVALSSERGTSTLTFFPNVPGNSTLHPEEKDELKRIMTANNAEGLANVIFGSKSEVEVSTERLSSILKDHVNQSNIDLLKIDVEGAELEVLKGIDEEHWGIIANITLEVCDLGGLLGKVTGLLESKGFAVKSTQSEWDTMAGNFYMVEATRLG